MSGNVVRRVLLIILAIAVGRAHAQGSGTPWRASWIAAPWSTPRDGAEADGSRPMPVFRRAFTVGAGLRHAELRLAGLGQWQAQVDGRGTIGGAGLHGDWTDFHKHVNYRSYDLTAQLAAGPHVLGVELGNGMYNVQPTQYLGTERGVHLAAGKSRYTKFEGSYGAPKLIAELTLRYANGRTVTVGSDAAWLVAPGETTFSSIYGGEDYDARLGLKSWTAQDLGRGAWKHAAVVTGPGGALVKSPQPETLAGAVHVPVKVTDVGMGKTVYDLGQNFASIVHLRVRGSAGHTLKLTPGELLNADGTVSQRSSGGPMWWAYTLNGGTDGEEWQPAFGYYGFRYVQAEWVDADPLSPDRIDLLEGVELHSASAASGTFASSSELLNRIHGLIVAAMHNNEVSLFTDCPQREKLGWLEETHLVADGLMFNNNVAGLYRATAQNIADAQGLDGMVPTIAPEYVKFGPKYPVYDDSPEWGSAAILSAWAAYRHYGDEAELARDYPVMQRYISYLISRAQDGIVAYGLGDWYDVGPKPPGFEQNTTLGVTGTLMLYEDAATLAKIAVLLGHGADAEGYGAVAAKIAAAYQRRFWVEDKGWYDTGSQTANAMPLALGIVPDQYRAGVLKHVIDDIHVHNDHVTTGEVGFPYLLRALMQAGRNDVIYALMTRTDPPSYGAQLAAGATALTEAWDANPHSSQDHFMLGAGEEWLYRGLAGIDFDLSRAEAAERITLQPALLPQLDHVDGTYDSRIGRVESRWKRVAGGIEYDVVVPGGSEATVILPGRAYEIGADLSGPRDVTLEARHRVTPGPHRFFIPTS